MRKQKLVALEREMKLEEDKLVAQMEFAKYEHETEKLRAELREREASRDQHRNQWEQRERETQVCWPSNPHLCSSLWVLILELWFPGNAPC
jgi:hypothetical protein